MNLNESIFNEIKYNLINNVTITNEQIEAIASKFNLDVEQCKKEIWAAAHSEYAAKLWG